MGRCLGTPFRLLFRLLAWHLKGWRRAWRSASRQPRRGLRFFGLVIGLTITCILVPMAFDDLGLVRGISYAISVYLAISNATFFRVARVGRKRNVPSRPSGPDLHSSWCNRLQCNPAATVGCEGCRAGPRLRWRSHHHRGIRAHDALVQDLAAGNALFTGPLSVFARAWPTQPTAQLSDRTRRVAVLAEHAADEDAQVSAHVCETSLLRGWVGGRVGGCYRWARAIGNRLEGRASVAQRMVP